MAQVSEPPPLPRSMYHPATLGGAAFVLYALALYLVPCWAAVAIAQADLPGPWPWRLLALVPLWLIGQQGLHLLGWVGHEGFHLALHRNKYVSGVMGVLASSLVLSFAQVGVAVTHWVHHRYTNQAADPDTRIFGRHQTLLRRLLFGRLAANRVFMANLLRVACNRPLGVANLGPFRPVHLRALAWLNIAALLVFTAGYVALAVCSPLAALVGVVIPHVLGILLSGPRPYLEHAATGQGVFHDARTYCSPVMTVLFAGNNFHLEHHLYPSVPCYRLPAVHRRLRAAGYYDRAGVAIEPRFWGALAHARARSRYPTGSQDGDGRASHA